MSLPSCSALVEELPGLPHAERVRRLVRIAREHDGEAGLAPLLDELTAASAYHAGLVVDAARAIGDTARLKALTRHPGAVVRIRARGALPLDVQSPDELAAAYLDMPLAERRRLEARLGRAHRTDLIDALLDLPLSDVDRARLLPRAGRERIEALLPDLADLLPSVAALAQRRPDALLDALQSRLTGRAPAARDEAWAWVAPGLPSLAENRSERLLGLLAEAGPTTVIPRALEPRLGLLMGRDPRAVTDLLRTCPWPAGLRPGWGPPRFIRGLRRRIAALADEQVGALARSWRAAKNEDRLIALLDALPPARRAGALAAALTGVRTRTRVWSAPALEVMPTPMRQAEAERMAALPDAEAPLRRLELAAFMTPEHAREAAEPRLHALDAEERGAAWRALIGSAARGRDAARLRSVLKRLPQLANEQDPVRAAAAEALSAVPVPLLARAGTDELEGFARAAMEARDTSVSTLVPLHSTAWRLLVHAAATGLPARGACALLELITDQDNVIRVPFRLSLPPDAVAELITALEPVMQRAAHRHRFALVFGLWEALGRRAWRNETLLSLIHQALGAPDDHVRRSAAAALVADPSTRAQRVGEILRADETFAVHEPIQWAVCRSRQDLVGVFFRRRALKGRFWNKRRFVPVGLPGPFTLWAPEHLRAYAGALTRALDDAVTTDWDRRRIAGALAALPTTRPEDLGPLLHSDSVQVVEGALAVLPTLDDAEAALGLLLEHAGTDRARVAMFAASRCADRVRPGRAVELLAPVTVPPAKVTSRKEAVRILGRMRTPQSLALLVRLGLDPTTHSDVRTAVGRALLAHLDEPDAWQVLRALASGGGRDAALSLAATSPRQLAVRHRAAYAEVLLTAPREPETLAALGQWCQEIPDLTQRLASTILDGQRVPARVAIATVVAHAERAADWGPHLKLVRDLLERATSPDEPDAGAQEDLPHLHRLEELVAGLVPDRAAALTWHREHLGRLAEVLSASPWTAGPARRVRLAAFDWAEVADAAATADGLADLADRSADEGLLADLLDDAAATLALARSERLLPDAGAAPGMVDALLARRRPAADVLALALTQDGGGAAGWPPAWRERLRALRRCPVALVAERARRIDTAAD
ncbi:hypothetical protein AM609_05550 [Actinomyces sp. oral taxon 414]|uniref:hypothetical protein n=1 Tax=Actinomyces sp. oral taxon 414 TaxID=712122 RepID=UPI0006AEEB8B|nr:hypothetical protein [Actinomyces sp. oral taxon 414]ALC99075.1 hypothetical protein AM609_05550 [Actinomyces sp. oral taxon 414]